VHPCKGLYGAGGSEDAGRVMEPRKESSCGHEDRSQGCNERKADGFQWPEGRSPRRAKASV